MATKRKSAARNGKKGSTLYGALAGLLIGLIVAASLAFYVTRAPLPFVDRATRRPDQDKLPETRPAPDPNSALYGRDGPAGVTPSAPTAPPITPLPNVAPAPAAPATPPKLDDLGALIATLPATPSAPPALSAPRAESGKPASTPKKNGSYFLQAGAYRLVEDAEALKARVILLGLPATVQSAEVNGKKIYRVRVGPFTRLEQLNRASARLGENKIESTTIRP